MQSAAQGVYCGIFNSSTYLKTSKTPCDSVPLKVPSGQIGSAWEWYHWIGLDKDINRYRFLFFIFDLEYLIRVQNSEPLHSKLNPTSCLFGLWLECTKTTIFSAELCSKNARDTSIFQDPAIQTKIEHHFGGFFHQIKVRQPIGRQDSMQTMIRTSRRLDSFLHCNSELWSLF